MGRKNGSRLHLPFGRKPTQGELAAQELYQLARGQCALLNTAAHSMGFPHKVAILIYTPGDVEACMCLGPSEDIAKLREALGLLVAQ